MKPKRKAPVQAATVTVRVPNTNETYQLCPRCVLYDLPNRKHECGHGHRTLALVRDALAAAQQAALAAATVVA